MELDTLTKVIWTILSTLGLGLSCVVLFSHIARRKVLLALKDSPMRRIELAQPIWTVGVRVSIQALFVMLGIWASLLPKQNPGTVNPNVVFFYSVMIVIDCLPVIATVLDLWADARRVEIVRTSMKLDE